MEKVLHATLICANYQQLTVSVGPG